MPLSLNNLGDTIVLHHKSGLKLLLLLIGIVLDILKEFYRLENLIPRLERSHLDVDSVSELLKN
jgi:hypothetical protein